MKPNQEIRDLIKQSNICSWQVAEKLNMHENSLGRLLRKELKETDRKRIFEAIEQLKHESRG